jgi:predicted metalloprotease with PDZ domain
MPAPRRSALAALAALAALLALAAGPLRAQPSPAGTSAPVTELRYEVRADSAAMASRQLHVTTTFEVAGRAPVLLSLPIWTPGAYEVSDFARFVLAFSATQGGAALAWDKADPDTWRLQPRGAGTVTVEFDVDVPAAADNAMTWTRTDLALFNGTNLFLYPEGRSLDFASTVTVRAEPGHLVVTGLPGSAAARRWRAGSYHELVDAPFMVGAFDLDSALIAGRPVRYATYPRGSVAGRTRSTAWEQLRRLIPVQVNLFGDVPWPSYTLMQVVDSTSGGYSGLEHANSHVDIVAPAFIGSELQPSLYAHELFHAWNVKRLRPADLTPYRYDRRQPTAWLWVSEGVTDYYADLSQVRAGTVDAAGFYALTAGKINEIAATVPFAVEDASINAWIKPRDGTEGSYYPKGSLAGLMLDIAIRDASGNRRSLDTVMRELYESTYKRGRGFTHDDWWGAVRRAAGGRSFEEFEARYIDGRDPYPWPTVLAIAGLELVADSAPRLGLVTLADSSGAVVVREVAPGSPADRAGVRPDDRLLGVGEVTVRDNLFPVAFRSRYAGLPAGSALPISVRRAGVPMILQGQLQYGAGQGRIEEIRGAPARAVRIRNGMLRGSVDP